MKKENIYIDLSKCTEEQINKIYSIIKNDNIDSFTRSRLRSGNKFNSYCLINEGDWVLTQIEHKLARRTELTYPEFIKLFEGGEGENNGWIKIESEADLPKLKIGEIIHCFIKSSDYENVGMGVFSQITNSFLTHFHNHYENVTHYQPIQKPKPPKF